MPTGCSSKEIAHERPFDCTLLAGEGKGRTSHTLHLMCGPVLSTQECDHEGDKGGCNHYTCVSLPGSYSYLLSQGNNSLLTTLAQPGQGSVTGTPEGMAASPGHEPQKWKSSAPLTSWVHPDLCFQETSVEIQSNRQGLYFKFKLQ